MHAFNLKYRIPEDKEDDIIEGCKNKVEVEYFNKDKRKNL